MIDYEAKSQGVLTVVMPVYNEENSIIQIVETVLARKEVGELVIVNDASTDSSWEKLQYFRNNERVKLINVEKNQGKGAALIRGFAEATRQYVLIQDADFEYSPEDYPIVLTPLLAGKADVLYGLFVDVHKSNSLNIILFKSNKKADGQTYPPALGNQSSNQLTWR